VALGFLQAREILTGPYPDLPDVIAHVSARASACPDASAAK
jgi:hypothetical protein